MSNDFFSNSSPAEIIIVLVISLALTLVTYCAIPLLMAYLRKKPIDKKIFWRNCMLANIPVAIIWSVIGESASVGPYIIWSNVFSSVGCKVLAKRGLLVEQAPTAPAKSKGKFKKDAYTAPHGTPPAAGKGPAKFCGQCGARLNPTDKFCNGCGARLSTPTDSTNF